MPTRALAVLLLAASLLACHQRESAGTAPSGDKPDVILVTIDTVRADSVGFSGNANVKTPFLDKLASEGIVFANAHAHNVVTLPSHTNILTGLYPYQHGVRENAGYKLAPKYETVATMLRRAGYATSAFVGAYPLDSRYGLNEGFDTYDDNYGKGAGTLDFTVQERPATAVLDAAATAAASASSGFTSTIRTLPTSRPSRSRRSTPPIPTSVRSPRSTTRFRSSSRRCSPRIRSSSSPPTTARDAATTAS